MGSNLQHMVTCDVWHGRDEKENDSLGTGYYRQWQFNYR